MIMKDNRINWKSRISLWIVVFCLVGMIFSLVGCSSESDNASASASNAQPKSEEKEIPKDTELEEFLNKKPLEINPYETHKNDGMGTEGYTTYLINQLMGPYFNEERDKTNQVVEKNTTSIPIKKQLDGKDRIFVMQKDFQEGGFCYRGEIQNGKPNGWGAIYIIKSLQNINGTIAPSKTELVQKGQYQNGKLNGFGISVKSGEIYQGTFVNGSPNGYGIFWKRDLTGDNHLLAIGKATDMGDSMGGISTSLGKLYTYVNEDKNSYNKKWVLTFEGSFALGNNLIIRKGKLFYTNGKLKYEGNFEDIINKYLYQGSGKEYYPDGKLKYEGEFDNGVYNGKGTFYNEDGSIKYDGNWKYGDYDIK